MENPTPNEVQAFDLNTLRDYCHNAAKAKGFHDKPVETGTLLMLVTSELGEALEADRKNKHTHEADFYYTNKAELEADFAKFFRNSIKDTFEDEIADALIRILDLCGLMKIDIGGHVAAKLRYNATRDRLHGKAY